MGESLRDQLEANFDRVVNSTVTAPENDPPASGDIPVPAEGAQDTEKTAAERARDEAGRFAKSETKPAESKVAQAKPQATPVPSKVTASPAPAEKIQRPSSWKKDHWEAFDKLAAENPALAKYLNERESQFANGVSTYKNEWERAKPVLDAMSPFMPVLQQNNINPAQWISNLGTAHYRLVYGSPQEKLQMLAKVAQDYGIPLQAYSDQATQQQYLSQVSQGAPALPGQQPLTEAEARALWQQEFVRMKSEQDVESFSADGKYQHFEKVRNDMAGLIQSGLAENLSEAYEAAIRLPKHAALWDQLQQQQREESERAKKDADAARVRGARAKNLSPRSSTPSGVSTEDKPKGLRNHIESAFEEVLGGR